MPDTPNANTNRSRVLFVDDDPFLLDGLRDALRPQRRRWDMTFAASGEEALSLLDSEAQDVVVSDLRMPAMDGATLLEHVRERCRSAIRIVLSGHGETRMVARAAAVAHRMISKPCDSEELTRVIESSCHIRDVANSERLDGRLFSDAGVPSVPRLYAEMTRLLSDGQATVADAARLVQSDIGMAAGLPLDARAAARIATVVVDDLHGDTGAAGAPGGRFSESESANPVLTALLERAGIGGPDSPVSPEAV